MRKFPVSCILLTATLAATAGCADGPSPTAPGQPGLPGALVTLVEVAAAIEVTAGGTGTFNWAGQSVTMPDGGSFNNLRFNWYTFQKTPTAFGNLYLLTQEYLGLPANLGPSTPGFVARSERVADSQYIFPADTVVNGSQTYWFYTDAQGSFAGSFDRDIYDGGDLYVTGFHSNPFRKAPASGRMVGSTYVPPPAGVFLDANFKLQGSAR